MTCRLGKRDLSNVLASILNGPDEVQEKPVVPRHRYSLVSTSAAGPRHRANRATLPRPTLLVQMLISQSFMAQTRRKCRSLWYLSYRGEDFAKRESKAGIKVLLPAVSRPAQALRPLPQHQLYARVAPRPHAQGHGRRTSRWRVWHQAGGFQTQPCRFRA